MPDHSLAHLDPVSRAGLHPAIARETEILHRLAALGRRVHISGYCERGRLPIMERILVAIAAVTGPTKIITLCCHPAGAGLARLMTRSLGQS